MCLAWCTHFSMGSDSSFEPPVRGFKGAVAWKGKKPLFVYTKPKVCSYHLKTGYFNRAFRFFFLCAVIEKKLVEVSMF